MVKIAMITSSKVFECHFRFFFYGNGGSENSVHHITIHKFNGKNYLRWSQLVMMYICGRGKDDDDYITDAKIAPMKNDAFYKTWFSENNMIMSWLNNSMEIDIGQMFLFYKTTKEI